jgi:hypothetical protein
VTTARRWFAVLAAAAFGVGLLGWVDLSVTWTLSEPGTVTDVAWGCLAGLLVPAACLAQLRRPRPDALLLCAAGAAGCVAAAVTEARFLVVAAAAAAIGVLLWRLGGAGTVRVEPQPLALALALALAVPLVVWAVRLAGERSATGDAHVTLDAVPALAAFAIAAPAAAVAAALTASRVTATCVGLAVAYLGFASVTSPHDEASAGVAWGALALAWGFVFVVVGARR